MRGAWRRPVDPFGYVLATEIGTIASDALALDDRVRIVFAMFLADVAEEDGNVRASVGSRNVRTRTRFGSRQHRHLPAPAGGRRRQRRPHPVSQALRDLHFAGFRMDFRRA